ncbi:MAG: glycosyltransferase [Alphaproteobacteria bacterium]|nr:glycosyltransferase [Alphaproteobacteria bacterium]MBU4039128.1 glycosyltransferase [Alphaproteobacteria bacterium]MBU4135127.1 glycosyltransferase [Alphaproteobacteria bacterium]
MTRLLVVGNGSIATDGRGHPFVHIHNAGLLTALARDGFTVTHLAPTTAYDDKLSFHNTDVSGSGVRVVGLRGPLSVFRLVREVWRADHVYLFFPGTIPRIGSLICRALRKPYGLYVRGERWDGPLDWTALSGARFILTVSPTLEASLREYCADVATILPMTIVGMDDTAPVIRPSGGPIRLLFVGNLLPAKGLAELLSACSLMKASGLDFTLRIVGSGAMAHDLARRIATEGLSEHVSLVGLISDKADLMAEYEAADVFVLPTHHEGFPRVLYEAMAKGCAVVTTMVGGIPGRMRDGENCVAVPVCDPPALAAAITRLAQSPQTRAVIGESGRQTVRTVLTTHQPHDILIARRIIQH